MPPDPRAEPPQPLPQPPDDGGEGQAQQIPAPNNIVSPYPSMPTAPPPQFNALPQPPIPSLPQPPSTAPQLPPLQATLPATGGYPPASTPGVVVSAHEPQGGPAVFGASAPKPKRWLKLALLIGLPLLLLGGGGAYAYLGYYMNPSVVWKQSLSNMNAGYGQLVSFVNTASSTHYKGVDENGSFSVKSDGLNVDGSLSAQSDSRNSTLSAKVDSGIGKIDLEERSITASAATEPDVYLQVNGIKGLTNAISAPLSPGGANGDQLIAQLNNLDGQWIVIDHNLLSDIRNNILQQEKSLDHQTQLSWAEVNSFLQAAGRINEQYVFTTNNNKSVTKILQTIGRETVEGHKTIHYKVGFVPDHVKAYVAAMCTAFDQSDLGAFVKQQLGQSYNVASVCKPLENDADKINNSDTIDVWADTNTRLIYKVRVSDPKNPAENFVDFGLDYKGSGSYPFFISGQSKGDSSKPFSAADNNTVSTWSLKVTLDSSKHSVNISVGLNEAFATNPLTVTGSFSFEPTTNSITVATPANAKPITDVLNEFGLGNYLTQLQSLGSNFQTTNHNQTPVPLPPLELTRLLR